MTKLDELATDADVAAMFGMPESWAAENRKLHKWPHIKVGRQIRYTDDDVALILRKHHKDTERSTPLLIEGQTSRSARRSA